jgi:predicted dehydrogenase
MFNWGIIGPGSIAHRFAQSVGGLDDTRIYAIASHSKEKAQAFADKYGAQKIFGSYKQLARCPEVDAIYIATTNPYHHKPAIMCLEHKKPVLCEKPFTLNAKMAQNMIDAARKNNTFLTEAMWTRFLPAMARVRKWLKDGAIGTPRLFDASFCVKFDPDPNSRLLSLNQGGGSLLDLGIYPLSFAAMVFGTKYDQISSAGFLTDTGVDEHTVILLKYPEGEIAKITCSLSTSPPHNAYIIGTEGYIEIERFWEADNAKLIKGGETIDSVNFDYKGQAFKYEAMEVAKCVAQGKTQSDIMPWDESLDLMKMMDFARAEMGLRYPQE